MRDALTGEKIMRKAIKLFLAVMLTACAFLMVLATIVYRTEVKDHNAKVRDREAYTVDLQEMAVESELHSIVGDLQVFAQQNELFDYFELRDTERLRRIENEFLVIAEAKGMYDQIRLLDDTGMELARVNFNCGKPSVVPANELQNKAHRYYFTECIKLQRGEIYISRLDLNIEQGKVETPHKPMIRFGTPVFDKQGNKRGIVLLNYLADQLLDRILATGGNELENKLLLDNHGYWLLAPDEDDTWGFMFEDRVERTFANRYPQEWEAMQLEDKGQIKTHNGLFSFTKVQLQNTVNKTNRSKGASRLQCACCDHFWLIISHITPDVAEAFETALMQKLLLGGAALFLLMGVGGWQLAFAVTKRNLYQAYLYDMAMFDPLTRLPNRKMFFDKLEDGLAAADRYDRVLGLLYVDLDGFKAVNDTFGHDAGDELLVRVAQRLQGCVRKSDMVARLGGDEFAVLLPEITDPDGARVVGDKMVEQIQQPFELAAGMVTIGASIGVAAYPLHANNQEDLIRSADSAMYTAKTQGKGTCVTAQEC